MKLHFQTRWLRVLIEVFPVLAEIRCYRAVPAALEGSTCRLLRQRIASQLRKREREVME